MAKSKKTLDELTVMYVNALHRLVSCKANFDSLPTMAHRIRFVEADQKVLDIEHDLTLMMGPNQVPQDAIQRLLSRIQEIANTFAR
jgi:hypothetical protein